MANLDMIEPMQVLTLNPGDTLVLKVNFVPTHEMTMRITDQVKRIVGDVPVLLLQAGTDIGVLRQAA